VDIRELDEADAAAFRAVRLRALRECPTAFASSYEEECEAPPEFWAQRAKPTERAAVLGAWVDAQLIGITGIRREERRKLEHRASVVSVYVSPESRRRRIARQLLDAAVARGFAMSGVRQVQLTVNVSNAPAIRLYRSAGFRQISVEPGHLLVDGVLQDELRLVLDREATAQQDWAGREVDANLVNTLGVRLATSELSALLIRVMSQRAPRRTVAELLRQWHADRFVAPSMINPRVQLALDQTLFDTASAFEAIELSPLAPLGSCSAVAHSSQNRTVSTIRGSEVVSDPTNVMALESARRLRADPTLTVKLAASHRCVRAQQFTPGSGIAAHFRMFCLTSAAHEVKDHGFVVNALSEHLRFHLTVLARIRREPSRQQVVVTLLGTPTRMHLLPRIEQAVLGMGVQLKREQLTGEYYDGLRFMIDLIGTSHERINLCDGGTFDWLATLTSNRRARFVASAFGSQRAAAMF
jgi:ribosomal protein S18 acetylase RimI-like enzyme